MVARYLTTEDIIKLYHKDHQYMCVPYTEQTKEALDQGTIDQDVDAFLEEVSDTFEDTSVGEDFAVQIVQTFGVIQVEKVINYETFHESYLLILVNVEESEKYMAANL